MRRFAQFTFAVILIGIAAIFFFKRGGERPRGAVGAHSLAPTPQASAPAAPNAAPKAVTGNSSAEPNPLAEQLNAPAGTIRRDLEVLNNVFVNFQTNFPGTGNPVGENAEITAALTGANPLHFAFLPKNRPAINAAGELCDRWGTPFRFHQLGGTKMEIRSAGPDKKFGTADDAEFAPWSK